MTTTDLVTTDDSSPQPTDILQRTLIGPEAVEVLCARLRAARFQFNPDDADLLAAAENFVTVETEEDYRQGYQLLDELSALDKRIEEHYDLFKGPLNKMRAVVLALVAEDQKPISGAPAKGQLAMKARISQIVGKWKADQDRKARELAAAQQKARDAAAQAAHDTRVQTVERLANTEPDPTVADVLRREADHLASVHVKAAPVAVPALAPKVDGGHVVETWKAEIFDLKTLVRAWLDGKCFLDEQPMIEALLPQLNAQAPNLRENLTRAYPGTRGVVTHNARTRRTNR